MAARGISRRSRPATRVAYRILVLLMVLGGADRCEAQDPKATPTVDWSALTRRATTDSPEERPPQERPRPRPWLAVAEVVGINVLYGLANQVVPSGNADDYHVSLRTWWHNLRGGFAWDNDPFIINQAGHPYQGSNYFTAGRALGLNYWQSLPLTTLGSVMWEYFGEKTQPAWNDVVNTTLGGAALGESLHRIAWLVRDPAQPAGRRWMREAAALVVDPLTGLNRLASGAAGRSGSRPREFQPPSVTGEFALGLVWRQGSDDAPFGSGMMCATFDVRYGRLEEGQTQAPFDAFTLNARLGGGSALGDASIKGRLAAHRFGAASDARHQLVLLQGYDYHENEVMMSGGQTMFSGLADRFVLSSTASLTTSVLGGAVLLGAVDSLNIDPRYERPFDMGSGVALAASAALTWRDHHLVEARVSRASLWTWTRANADHVETRYAAIARLPITGGLHLNAEVDAARRTSTSGAVRQLRSYMETRASLAWVFGK